MKDAISNAVVIQIIIIFLVIINSYLAFSVNYTRAFRIKNNIVSTIERYEGLTREAHNQIEEMMANAGYSISDSYLTKCGASGYEVIRNSNGTGGFCAKISIVGNAAGEYQGTYYSVVTYVNIDLPFLNKILPVFANAFAIKGETKTILSSGTGTELRLD